MEVEVRLFAGLRQRAGSDTVRVELPEPATVGDLLARLRSEHPRFAALPPGMLVSVNLEYRPAEHPLGDGDEVGFIPPVSGGATK